MERLQALYARRAKANALGVSAIRAAQELYDNVCMQIGVLEVEMFGHTDIMLELLENVIQEAMELDWAEDVDCYEVCKRHYPALMQELETMESRLTALNSAGLVKEFVAMLPRYRSAWRELYGVSLMDGVLVEKMNFETFSEETPWG
ncbi:hypothetical protein LJC42_00195 [Eubacteriales bacterium OttesenSCG-928-K08]|nr:hypothetical protein [Eubacteriales bacterium OttesenSCG-928-K08]